MTNEAAASTVETAAVAEQGASVAPEKASSKKGASQKKGAPKGQKAAKKAAPPKKEAKSAPKPQEKATSKKTSKAGTPREGSKKDIVLDLLRRKEGATMAEVIAKTGWMPHSVRGFISGQLTKKMGLKIESSKNDAGERTYRLAK
jgi:hypothetical protein